MDGVQLSYQMNEGDNMLAIYNFCQQLSSCEAPSQCPSLSSCMATLEPVLAKLESMLSSLGEEVTTTDNIEKSNSDDVVDDLTFEVIVDSNGRRANFIYHAGSDINAEVTSFCKNEIENEEDIEACRKAMLDAVVRSTTAKIDTQNKQGNKHDSHRQEELVDWNEKNYSFFNKVTELVELQVQVDTGGATSTFRHFPQQNPYLEADAFCLK